LTETGLTRREVLRAGAAVGALAGIESLASPAQILERALATSPNRRRGWAPLREREHVVIFINENRSFDSYFGDYRGVRGFRDPNVLRLHDGSGKSILLLRFLETRRGYEAPNLSAWRRSVTGDLTSAFNFAAPADPSVPSLPKPSRADPRILTSDCPTQAADTERRSTAGETVSAADAVAGNAESGTGYAGPSVGLLSAPERDAPHELAHESSGRASRVAKRRGARLSGLLGAQGFRPSGGKARNPQQTSA
jgi:phospholipase C